MSDSPINAFSLSVTTTMLVSLVCMPVLHALNFANVEKRYSLRKCSTCTRYLLETVLLVLASCKHEPQNASS
jgi:hypothetical protein